MNDKETRKLIIETVKQTVPLVLAQRMPTRQSGYKATEQRLYAYPVLMDNVHNRWPADIEDLRREKVSETSKSIVRWSEQAGVKLSPEERQEGAYLRYRPSWSATGRSWLSWTGRWPLSKWTPRTRGWRSVILNA